MQPQNHALPIRGIFKTKLQAFGPSNPETLQSQTHQRSKIRLSVKGLQVVHGQLNIARNSLTIHGWERLTQLAEFDPSYPQLGGV
jgi:hypothetical protein